MVGQLESALVAFEAEIAAATKSLGAIKTSLGNASKAAQTGHIRDIDKALAALSTAGAEFSRRLSSAQNAWAFDAEQYLASGAFTNELVEAAAVAGLKLFERDGRIYCFPMLLSVSAKDLALLIDRKPVRQIRPSLLVKALDARQRQPQKFSAARLLETLFEAYSLVALRFDRNWGQANDGAGPVVPLIDIYEALTLLPGATGDYPIAEFTRDIYLLDRQPDTRTKDGRRFSLPNSTGSKGGKRLTVTDDQGGERVYVGLAFHKEA
jgi:hypothetical protein